MFCDIYPVSCRVAGRAFNRGVDEIDLEKVIRRKVRVCKEVEGVKELTDKYKQNGLVSNHRDFWFCPVCGEVEQEEVTYEETHDVRFGGCGSDVEFRRELI